MFEVMGMGERDRLRAALTEQARGLATRIAALQAELVGVAAEVAALPPPSDMTHAQWLAWQCGLTPAEARRTVRLAQRLPRLPRLAAAFAAGQLSEGTVATLERVAGPDNEGRLLDTAEVATGAQLQALARSYARATADRPGAAPVGERLSTGVDATGMWRISARLRPERGAQVEAALQAARERGDDPADGPEALVEVAQAALGAEAGGDGRLPERFLAVVHIDGDAGGVAGVVRGGGPLPPSSLREVLCESWITAVVSQRGQPVTVTSPTRFATPAQHRALLVRDRTCRFPGCGRATYLKAHHLVGHALGGPTRLDNLVLLCQRHHTLVHRPGWRIERDPGTARVQVWRPDGLEVDAGARRSPSGGGGGPVAAVEPLGPRRVGTGDRLDRFASSVVVGHWMTASTSP